MTAAVLHVHWDAIVIHPDDNVAVALHDLLPGRQASCRTSGVTSEATLLDAIPIGHKFALQDIAAGALVRKYGESIGEATAAIAAGAHVHVHNLVSRRGRSDS